MQIFWAWPGSITCDNDTVHQLQNSAAIFNTDLQDNILRVEPVPITLKLTPCSRVLLEKL